MGKQKLINGGLNSQVKWKSTQAQAELHVWVRKKLQPYIWLVDKNMQARAYRLPCSVIKVIIKHMSVFLFLFVYGLKRSKVESKITKTFYCHQVDRC